MGARNSTSSVAYAMLACQYPCSHVHELLSIQFAILHSYMPQHPRSWPYAIGLACWSTPLGLRMTAHDAHIHTHTLTHNSSDRWVKRWATSCVKWTEGRGVLAIMVKQTAKRGRRVCARCTTKKVDMGMCRNTCTTSNKTILPSKKKSHLDNQHILETVLIEHS